MSPNCPQAVSKLKAYQKTHQDLKKQFSDFMSQFPYLPNIKTDEPFMQSPYYQTLTDSPKEVFHNLYDAKQEDKKQLAELKEITEKYKEEDFSKLTTDQKLEHLYSRCFKPSKEPDQELQYIQPIPDLYPHEIRFLYEDISNGGDYEDDEIDDEIKDIINNRKIKKD